MLSWDKRWPLVTWNPSGSLENFFANPRSTRVITNTLSRHSSIYDTKCCRWGSRAHQHRESCGKRRWKSRKHNPNARLLQEGRRLWAPLFLWIFHSSMVGQQRQQISELQFNKFPDPQSVLVWKIRSKTQVTTCADFPSEAIVMH